MTRALDTQCKFCNLRHTDRANKWYSNFVAFVLLYLVGIVELSRQLFLSTFIKPSECRDDDNNLPVNNEEKKNSLIILSGASSGIGKALRPLLKQYAQHLIILDHNGKVGTATNEHLITIDLESRESTETSCTKLIAIIENNFKGFNVLFVHAAAVYNPKSEITLSSSSICSSTKTLVINTLMPCVLLNRLRNIIDGVVFLGSSSHWAAPQIRSYECPIRKALFPRAMYPLSKMLTIFTVEAWAAKFLKPALVIHPGIVATHLYRDEPGILGTVLRKGLAIIAWDAKQSARRIIQTMQNSKILTILENNSAKKLSSTNIVSPHFQSLIYWDAVTMKQRSLPSHFPDCRERKLVGDQMITVAQAWK